MPVELLAQPEDIRSALPGVMSGSLVESVVQVVRQLRASGLRLPAAAGDAQDLVANAVDSGGSLWTLSADYEVVNLAAVMSGRVLTHRLSPREAADETLEVDLDFPGHAFEHLAATGLTAADGQVLGLFDDPAESLDTGLRFHLPDGTYGDMGVGAGDLVGVVFSDGEARLVTVEAVGDAGALASDLSAFLAGAGSVNMDEPFDHVMLLRAAHFQDPLPPVTELVVEHGLGRDGDLIAESAEVIEADRLAHLADHVASEFELGSADAQAVVGAVWYARALEAAADPQGAPTADLVVGDDTTELWLAGRMADLQGAMAVAPVGMLEVRLGLADPWVSFVVADQALNREDPCPEGLGLLAQFLAESKTAPAARGERAALEYLIARSREHAGEPLAAERHFHRAVDLDPDHSYAMLGLAGIAADRGQYEAAQSLLERAGADERHPLRVTVARAFADTAAPTRLPGRNEACWCGSGRKFKACHARVSTSPLPGRARAILGRALAWSAVTDPNGIRRLLGYGVAISGGRASIDALAELVPDVLLFEGGGLADYLDRRAALIPDDEAMLAQAWLLRPRSLFEVKAVRAGQGMSLRDLMTGDEIEVAERSASQQLKVGELLLTRVASVGDHDNIFGGGTLLNFGERDRVIDLLTNDPRPSDVIGFVARRFRPPEVVTPEGDPLESVEGTFTTTAPAQLRRALDEHLDQVGEDSWHLLRSGSGQQRVMGTVDVAGRTLTVSALSVARYEQLLAVLDDLDVPLVEKSRDVRRIDDEPGAGVGGRPRDPSDGTSGLGEKPGTPTGFLSPAQIEANPELLAGVAAYIAEYERGWLDESIPALGGVTPRQAAADPTRRGDLIALLDSFPATGSLQQMDGQRLRATLGL